MRQLTLLLTLCSLSATAQIAVNEEDALQRGYYDRPWQRYEAEPDKCNSNGEFLLPPSKYSQQPVQAEASNLTALSLRKKGEYVEWTVDHPGRGLTLRFSLPDHKEGGGIKGNFSLLINDREYTSITADSYWAWQYTSIANTTDKYPDNTPADNKFARMRFDEKYLLLEEDVKSGDRIRLVKADDNDLDYIIDFIELEQVAAPITFESLNIPDKVKYDGSTSLSSFISANSGKAIFIPEGTYNLSRQLHINGAGTRLIGAGMWHTRLYFQTPSSSREGYNARGIHCNVSNVTVEGMSIDTANDRRYFENNPTYQVGKGLNGSWGENSVARDLRIDHFECGAWISGARNLTVERCRFRNNYADGINLANNSTGCKVSHCSFRNNGDDDMASWSTGSFASDNEFSYCTAENNWRASSLGFFGGCRGKAHHIAIYDAMESGARVVCDFNGTGFSDQGFFVLEDITIRRCGAKLGVSGTQGGFWGDPAAALQLGAGWAYDLKNIRIASVDIYDSRYDAISIKANSGKKVLDLQLDDIYIKNVDDYRYGVSISSSVKGYGSYRNIKAEGVTEPYMSDIPAGFDFKDLSAGVISPQLNPDNTATTYYDLTGNKIYGVPSTGIYLKKTDDGYKKVAIF